RHRGTDRACGPRPRQRAAGPPPSGAVADDPARVEHERTDLIGIGQHVAPTHLAEDAANDRLDARAELTGEREQVGMVAYGHALHARLEQFSSGDLHGSFVLSSPER